MNVDWLGYFQIGAQLGCANCPFSCENLFGKAREGLDQNSLVYSEVGKLFDDMDSQNMLIPMWGKQFLKYKNRYVSIVYKIYLYCEDYKHIIWYKI